MKKLVYAFMVLTLMFVSGVSAFMCGAPENMEAFCSLHATNITKTIYCSTLSETNDLANPIWKLPVSYYGSCWQYPSLSTSIKDKIDLAFSTIYNKYATSDRFEVLIGQKIYIYLNLKIQQEYAKGYTGANLEKMAAMHYAASLIGPGYVFQLR